MSFGAQMLKRQVHSVSFCFWFFLFCLLANFEKMCDDLPDLPQLINLVDYDDSDVEVDVVGGFSRSETLNETMTDICFDPDHRFVSSCIFLSFSEM